MKVTTAYFVFSEEQRQSVRSEILAERGEGAKASVCEVAKAIGQRWKGLSDEEKDAYKQKAAARAQEAHAAEPAGEDDAEEEAKEPSPLDSLLPISIIRRIVLADPETSRVSNEGIVAIAKAADLLLGILAKAAASQAKGQKRRTIQLKDFVQAVKQDRRLTQAGLRDVEAAVKAAMEADADTRSLKAAAQAEAEAAAAVDNEPAADLGDAPAEGAEEHGDPGPENTDPAAGEPGSKAGKRQRGAGPGAEQKGGKTSAAAGKRRKSLPPPPAGRKIDSFFGKVTAPQEA